MLPLFPSQPKGIRLYVKRDRGLGSSQTTGGNMTARTKPPFRAEHVGSLLRPGDLKKARAEWEAGRITHAELTAWEESEIFGVVRRQEEIGLQAVTDGEFRRDSWHMDFYRQIGGLFARGT